VGGGPRVLMDCHPERSTDVPRGPCRFRQLDVTRAIQAAFAAGARKAQVEVGGIVITALKFEEEQDSRTSCDRNEWDAPLAVKDSG
jgi:hypothetical protein